MSQIKHAEYHASFMPAGFIQVHPERAVRIQAQIRCKIKQTTQSGAISSTTLEHNPASGAFGIKKPQSSAKGKVPGLGITEASSQGVSTRRSSVYSVIRVARKGQSESACQLRSYPGHCQGRRHEQ